MSQKATYLCLNPWSLGLEATCLSLNLVSLNLVSLEGGKVNLWEYLVGLGLYLGDTPQEYHSQDNPLSI